MATLHPDYNQLFINPYNFVSKTSCVTRTPVENGRLSGSVNGTIIVKNRLALPDHDSDNNRRYDFYSVNGKPVIPGSEIKGCIRSVFEAITPSCFSVMNANVLTKRLSRPDNTVLPGILRYMETGWAIYTAEKRKYASGDDDSAVCRVLLNQRIAFFLREVLEHDRGLACHICSGIALRLHGLEKYFDDLVCNGRG